MKLAVVIDPIEKLNPKKDSSIAMLRAAATLGLQLFYMTPADMYVVDGKPYAKLTQIEVSQTSTDWYSSQPSEHTALTQMDIIIMRKDPPFDMNYIYTTYLLELAENQGTLVVNKPQGLRDANEKYFTTQFPQCCPPTLISQDKQLLQNFWQQHSDVIYKPLDGMGGRSIFHVTESGRNINVIIDTLTENGQVPIMAQRYLPAIRTQGDKRILIVDDYVVPYTLARIPQGNDERGNLAQGAEGVVAAITPHELQMAQSMIPTLQARGLTLVGLDVIGEHVTEINVTSPTCLVEIEKATNEKVAERLIAKLLDFVKNRQS